MKKLALTLAIVLGLGMASFAQGGLFQRGDTDEISIYRDGEGGIMTPGLPGHGETGDQDATPLGSGVVALLGLGAAYLVGKKRNQE